MQPIDSGLSVFQILLLHHKVSCRIAEIHGYAVERKHQSKATEKQLECCPVCLGEKAPRASSKNALLRSILTGLIIFVTSDLSFMDCYDIAFKFKILDAPAQ
jgi:hypothetical protein